MRNAMTPDLAAERAQLEKDIQYVLRLLIIDSPFSDVLYEAQAMWERLIPTAERLGVSLQEYLSHD